MANEKLIKGNKFLQFEIQEKQDQMMKMTPNSPKSPGGSSLGTIKAKLVERLISPTTLRLKEEKIKYLENELNEFESLKVQLQLLEIEKDIVNKK